MVHAVQVSSDIRKQTDRQTDNRNSISLVDGHMELRPVIYLDRSLFGVDGWSRSALAVDLLIFLVEWSGFRGFGASKAPVLYLV